ncbi:importin subunit alpha-9 [Vespa crabro]|uniref:importin subunit alpha-9 n=1 Tax=Vespa crabro TaxID=7445 RepID=UPI001F0207A3|nr:importin subunit alpha-9 [Vespa crabro]XP_046816919.1 importin subunit alpha-9 [Vespa crabro]
MEVIRERLREAINTERKEQRAIVVNKNRPALGECIENTSYSSIFVTQMAKKLKKKTLNVNDYRRLQNALIQSELNIETLLKVDNIIFALARDISSNNPISQLGATNCCCNIALSNTKACTAIAKHVSPYIITECESLNRPLLEVCLWTIGNLSSGSKKAFEILQAQKCLQYIIVLMRECDNTILSSVIYAALHYIYGGFSSITEIELVELAEACKNRNLLEQNANTFWLLALLSSNIACSKSLYYALPSIVDFLHQSASNNFSNTTLIAAYLRILANVLSNASEEIVNIFLKNPKYSHLDVQILLRGLLFHCHKYIRKETMWLLGNLCNHASSNINQKIQDIISFLSPLEEVIASTMR